MFRKIGMGIAAAIPALTLFAGHAFAAADPDVLAVGTQLATSTKENVVALATGNIGYIGIVFALVIGIFFVMRLFKRAAR